MDVCVYLIVIIIGLSDKQPNRVDENKNKAKHEEININS